MFRSPNQCIACEHVNQSLVGIYGSTWSCKAYPKAIPGEIVNGGEDHRTARGDEKGGRVFKLNESDPNAAARLADWVTWREAMDRASSV